MADKTQEARARRTADRDRRRSRVAEQFEEMDESARGQAEDASARNGELAQTAAKVVGSVVAAALLGAAAAAAKGLLERQRADEQQTPEEPRSEDDEDGAGPDLASAEPPATEQEQASPEAADFGQADEEPPEAVEDQDEQEEQEQEQQEPVHGVSGGEAAEVVGQARRQLEGLLGVEPERVSGLARENGGWSVMLEVVEMARVPESTDVLATYELKLDDDLNIVTVDRLRRYRRSQTDEES